MPPTGIRFTLTFVVPVAFATTVPAQALNGQVPLGTFLAARAAACGLVAVSRLVWLRGLRRYSGASA
jgi:ABC-2 type transport system permease protein